LPAGFCGIVGHKPTGGLVPTAGHWPTVGDGTDPMLTVGPMVRHVADVLPVLRVMAGEEAGLPMTLPPLEGLQVHVVEGRGVLGTSAVVKRGVRAAAEVLAAGGATLHTERLKLLMRGADGWVTSLFAAGGDSFDQMMSGGGKVSLLKEMALAPFGRSKHIGPVLIVLALERLLSSVGGDDHTKGLARVAEMREELEALLGDDGVLLCPIYPTTAPKHGAGMLRPLGALWTAAFNAMHFPVTVVPIGFDARGLPLTVQVVGARGADLRTIAVAQRLEEAMGGWTLADPT
jgi:fatty acid amide hydrolase 2